MTRTRREALASGLAAAASIALPVLGRARADTGQVPFAPKPGAWRTFEVTTVVEIAAPQGRTQIWVPVPAFNGPDWMRPGDTTWQAPGGEAALERDPQGGADAVHAIWNSGAERPRLTVTSRVSTRDRAVDISSHRNDATLPAESRARYTAATEMIPTDGIVRETAVKAVAGAASEVDKARRLYEWIVDNTFRDPKTRGCGVGDVGSMLKMGNLGGKCADLNALYVGLARAVGLPARDIYGLRIAPSAFGYKSLGAGSATVTKAQHCRAEVFITGIGWLPVDPADVRKVVLEEPPGNLALDDSKVQAARKTLFGAWETNWLAYNDGHDVKLPGSKAPALPFLMYPQAETERGPIDPLDPDAFRYTITSKEFTT